jgi:hypothetical protein
MQLDGLIAQAEDQLTARLAIQSGARASALTLLDSEMQCRKLTHGASH